MNATIHTPQDLLAQLAQPFHPSRVTWKPGAVKGERALALAYADLRVYMDRLDEVCALDWSVEYQPWGDNRIICRLTIAGVTRSSTGESTNEAERGEIGGTVAEAQALKRAAAMFGMGRYLYNLPTTWADFDPSTKQFTAQAKAKLTGSLVAHYRQHGPQNTRSAAQGENTQPGALEGRSDPPVGTAQGVNGDVDMGMGGNPFETEQPAQRGTISKATLKRLHALGGDLYKDGWEAKRAELVANVSKGAVSSAADLLEEEARKLCAGMDAKLAQMHQPDAQPAANGAAA